MNPEMPMIADDPTPTAPAETNDGQHTPEPSPPSVTPTPALARFHSCRWRAQPDEGSFCTHRDVLPMAGKTGFNPESWCPECEYFKVRRAPRKRESYNNNY